VGVSRILVVDDESGFGNCAWIYCPMRGFEVEAATDGQKRWTDSPQTTFHLVLTDINMPTWTG
jgi:DNA-binding response OmpR family regulator